MKESGKPTYMAQTVGTNVGSFKEGFASVKVGGSFFFIDKNGRLLNKYGFRDVKDFHDGVALVTLDDGSNAFISKNGEILKTPRISELPIL